MKSLLILATIFLIAYSQTQTIECDTTDPTYVEITQFPNYQQNPKFEQPVCSYSQYYQDGESKFFYWYFPSTTVLPLELIPMLVVINGPLGESVLQQQFAETGPLYFDGENNTLTERDNSWTDYMSVIYLDIQAGVGFNLGEEQPNLEAAAQNLGNALIYLQSQFNQQKFSLIARGFSAKIALRLNKDIKLLQIIYDNPLIDTVTTKHFNSVGALGIGVYGPESEKIIATLQSKCENASALNEETAYTLCTAQDKFFEYSSDLDSFDARLQLQNSVTKNIKILDDYMNKNIDEIKVLLHIDEFNKRFKVTTKLPDLEPQYGLNCTSLFINQMTYSDISIFYGEFNLNVGALGGHATIMDTLGITYKDYPTKHEYTSGIASPISGKTLGYSYRINKDQPYGVNLFTFNQGGYFSTWLEYSTEVIYNMATNLQDFCYPYNSRNCSLNFGRQEFMQNCNGNGKWSSSLGQCTCASDYTLADCSLKITNFDTATSMSKELKPREWQVYYLDITTVVLLKILSKTYYPTTLEAIPFEVYLSNEAPSIDAYENIVGQPYQISTINVPKSGEVNLVYGEIGVKQGLYIAIRNSDNWELTMTEVSYTVHIPYQSSFWQEGEAGFPLSISVFSIGCLLILGGVIKFGTVFFKSS